MPKYVIGRDIPRAGNLHLKNLAENQRNRAASSTDLETRSSWIHSYVTDDKVYRKYTRPSKALIEQHANENGFPANRISEVKAMIDATRG